MDNNIERRLFYDTTMSRVPISQKMSMVQNESIVMFHALTQYRDCIYYVPNFQVYVILKESAQHVEVIDVISKEPFDLLEVLESLPIKTSKIKLCFTPDNLKIPVVQEMFKDEGAMFVKNQIDVNYPNNLLYPYSGLA